MSYNVRGKFQEVSLDLLNVPRVGDDAYQRSPRDPKAVAKIARDWNWALCGAVMCVRYPGGKLEVVDGGHRRDAAFSIGLPSLPCLIYDVPSVADAAHFFRRPNKDRTNTSALDDHRAGCVSADPLDIEMHRIFSLIGRRASPTASPSTVSCLKAVRACLAQDAAVTEDILLLMKDLSDGHILSARMLKSLVFIERALRARQGGNSLASTYRSRVLACGFEILEAEIARSTGQEGSGNALWKWQAGALKALNAGYKGRDIIKIEPRLLDVRSANISASYAARANVKKVELLSAIGRRNRRVAAAGGVAA